MRYQEPVVDDLNPFYCPALDAVAFLQDLRHQLHSGTPAHIPSDCLPSFAECLDRSLDEVELQELSRKAIPQIVHSPDVSDLTFSTFFCNQSTPVPHRGWQAAPPVPVMKARRKRPMSPETFSDMLAPPKKEKSIQSINESSFELSAKAEKLRYFSGSQDALYSPHPPREYGYSDAGGAPTAFELERKIRALEGVFKPPDYPFFRRFSDYMRTLRKSRPRRRTVRPSGRRGDTSQPGCAYRAPRRVASWYQAQGAAQGSGREISSANSRRTCT